MYMYYVTVLLTVGASALVKIVYSYRDSLH
jgi:hypothetical protein